MSNIPVQFPHPDLFDAFNNDEYSTNATEPWTQQLLATLMHCYDATNILEIGCHTGLTSAWLACALENAGGGTLTLIDVDPEYCKQANKRIQDLNLENVKVFTLCGTAVECLKAMPSESIEFAFVDFVVDTAQIRAVLEHLWSWYDPDMPHIMVPGGLIAVHDITHEDAASAVVAHQGYRLYTALMHQHGGLGLIQLPGR